MSYQDRSEQQNEPGKPQNTKANSEEMDERKRLRRLQIMMNMVMSVISQQPGLTIEEASQLCADTKRAALAMFPDKEFAYDILYKPRLQRILNERFRLQ